MADDRLNALIREPYEGEVSFFKENPETAGMMTEDGKIILNPFSPLSEEEKGSVVLNEASRLFMKQNPDYQPQFDLLPEQSAVFKGTPYENDPAAQKSTFAARVYSGDPSAVYPTKDQMMHTKRLHEGMEPWLNSLQGVR